MSDDLGAYDYNLVEAVLVASATAEGIRIVTFEDLVSGEFANAVLEHVTEIPNQINYRQLHEMLRGTNMYEEELYTTFNKLISSPKKELHPKVREAVTNLLKPKQIYPDLDKPYSTTRLYTVLYGADRNGGLIPFPNPCHIPRTSSYKLTPPKIECIKKEMVTNFSEDEIKDINEIGRLMRKYIDKDFEAINQTL